MTTPVKLRRLKPNREEAAKPAWWNLYKDAIFETDHAQVPSHIRPCLSLAEQPRSFDKKNAVGSRSVIETN